MKNYLEDGAIVVVTAPADTASGDFVIVGLLYGVAQLAALNGQPLPLVREGVFSLPKLAGTAWTQGDALYWDSVAKNFTKVASGNKPVGVAFADALSADTTGQVSLDENPESQLNALNSITSGKVFVCGQATTVAAVDTIATGLTTVIAAGASLDSDPGDNPMLATASIGDQAGAPVAGSILLKTWQNTTGTDPTPIAATTFVKKVNWWAYGTK